MQFDTQGWYLERGPWGKLDAILLAPRSGPPSTLVTLCHGFGAPGTDLVSLVEEIVPQLPDDLAPPAFLFPEGPIDLSESHGMLGARAWWPLNMAMLAELAATENFDALRETVPEGLDEARADLEKCILGCVQSHDWPIMPHVLGGFSQGAMLAVDTTLRTEVLLRRGLIVWSGALICEHQWRAGITQLPANGFIFQSHGRQDPILPIGTGRALHGLLTNLDWQLESMEFDGPHTIPIEGLSGAAQLIAAVVRSALN